MGVSMKRVLTFHLLAAILLVSITNALRSRRSENDGVSPEIQAQRDAAKEARKEGIQADLMERLRRNYSSPNNARPSRADAQITKNLGELEARSDPIAKRLSQLSTREDPLNLPQADKEAIIRRLANCSDSCALIFPINFSDIDEVAGFNDFFIGFAVNSQYLQPGSSKIVIKTILGLVVKNNPTVQDSQYPLEVIVKTHKKDDEQVSEIFQKGTAGEFVVPVSSIIQKWVEASSGPEMLIVMVKDSGGAYINAREIFTENLNTNESKDVTNHYMKITFDV